ncbi:MAG: uncharacterized protein KVP18_005035 [Porospora cf. gigantea A]|uniref:uncharacterized protein n=1 Tax=Porospora cf. gigantea A TaxID=2853593 RepID=UPI00355A6414|nr:MAG: hypothetical protein KVP18_005035 [Porospora cf. gigantea A]
MLRHDRRVPLCMYDGLLPQPTATLAEIRESLLERLQVLQFIYSNLQSSTATESFRTKLKEVMLTSRLTHVQRNGESFEPYEKTWRRDKLSHALLGVCFSDTKERADWFVEQECHLFDARFEMALDDLAGFANKSEMGASFLWNDVLGERSERIGMDIAGYEDLDYSRDTLPPTLVVPADDWDVINEFLESQDEPVTAKCWHVPLFPHSTKLVHNRRCLAIAGKAVVGLSASKALARGLFNDTLLQQMSGHAPRLQRLLEEPRLNEFVNAILKTGTSTTDIRLSFDTLDETRRLSLQNVWEYSKLFPPCMRRLVEMMAHNKHLRNLGRLQLWAFLKTAGMTMDELTRFVRQSWRDPTEVDKQHAYTIRHLFGTEGSRVNKSGYSCRSIISFGVPAAGDYHGCPFRSQQGPDLSRILNAMGVSDTTAILDWSNRNHFELACQQTFKTLFPGHSGDGVANHPNAFLVEAIKELHKENVIK